MLRVKGRASSAVEVSDENLFKTLPAGGSQSFAGGGRRRGLSGLWATHQSSDVLSLGQISKSPVMEQTRYLCDSTDSCCCRHGSMRKGMLAWH